MLDYEPQNTKWAQLALHTESEVLAVHGVQQCSAEAASSQQQTRPTWLLWQGHGSAWHCYRLWHV